MSPTLDAPTTRRLQRHVAVGVVGLLLMAAGLAVDTVLHARDPNLAGDEGLFTLENPGHLLLGIGIVAAAFGLIGAAAALVNALGTGGRALRTGQALLGTSLVVLVGAAGYAIAAPGGSHDHAQGGSDLYAEGLSERYSQIPPAEAVAFVDLSLSRTGGLDNAMDTDHGAHKAATEITPEDAETLNEQLALATAAVPQLNTVEKAEAAGFVPSSPRAEGVGIHWTKWSLVDRPFDPAEPSQLLFEEVTAGQGPQLVGFSYWVASHHQPEGFAGETDAWHQHLGLCFVDGLVVNEEVGHRSDCAGDWIKGNDLWMLHVWVVPGMGNRLGVFANINPRFCERYCE